MIDEFSWHWIFLINLPIGALALLLAWLCVGDSANEKRPHSIDYLGFVLLAVGVGSLQILLERGEHWDWLESNLSLLCMALALLGLLGFCYWERRVANPIVNLALFNNREFLLGSVCAFCVGFGLYSTLFMVPCCCRRYSNRAPTKAALSSSPGPWPARSALW